MILALIENDEHLRALCRHKADPSEVECWIYDPELAPSVTQLGFSIRVIRESDLREEFDEISAWARSKALNLFTDDFLSSHLTFYGVNLLDAISHFASYSLAWLVGCYQMIDLHFSKDIPSKVFYFERSGETCFNAILAAVAKDRGIPIEKIVLLEQPASPGIKSLKEQIRQMIGNIFRSWSRFWPYPKNCFVFCGGLRHLAPLISNRNDRGPFILLEDLFQAEQFRYCRKNHLRYALFQEWLTPTLENEIQSSLLRVKKLRATIINHIEQKDLLSFRGKKMACIGTFMTDILERHFPHCLRDIVIARRFSEMTRPRAVVLDDDTSNLRSFALSLRHLGIRIFVIAHGEVGLNYQLPAHSSKVSVGEMFVNSTYSELKYGSAGWDSSKLIVTGLPRYDRIAKMIRSPAETKPSILKKVLYCPHYMSINAIKAHKPFGESLRAGEMGTILNNKAVLDAAETVECDLWIKFYREETEAWRKYLTVRKIERIRCFHHSEDIFRLLNECDILIGGEFSTVILEGMMAGKPVISLNLSGLPDVHPYAREGLVWGVYQPKDLTAAIRTCLYDADYIETLRQKRQQRMGFYWAGSDGRSTERVWQRILTLTEARNPADFKNELSGSGCRQSTNKEHCLHGN